MSSKIIAIPKQAQTVLAVVLVGAGAYVAYKLYQQIAKGIGTIGDLVGAGTEAKKAELAQEKAQALTSAFTPGWIDRNRKPGTVTSLTTKWMDYAVKFILGKSGYLHNITSPMSFYEDRQAVATLLKNGIKSKYQLGVFSNYFYKKTNQSLVDALENFYLNSSMLTGGEYQKMFGDLINYLNSLK